MPWALMESTSSTSASALNMERGCHGLGEIREMATSSMPTPDALVACSTADSEPSLISASNPRPNPFCLPAILQSPSTYLFFLMSAKKPQA